MTRIVLDSKVGPDGVLHLEVPVGPSEANRQVRVTVEDLVAGTDERLRRAEDWQEFVRRTAGAWQGDLERPAQGDYEVRTDLS